MNVTRKLFLLCCLLLSKALCAQVDTSYVFNSNTSFGPLDIRIAKSASEYYYLDEGRTFSFRKRDNALTNTFLDMTAWESEVYDEGNMRLLSKSSDQFVMNYRLLIPEGYDASYENGYPLVLLLHGLQERGNCAGASCYHGTTSYSPNVNNPPASTASDNKLLNNDYNLVHGGSNYLEAHNINGSILPDDPALPPRGFPGFVLVPQNLNGWNAQSAEDVIRLIRLMIKKYNININKIYINGVSDGGRGSYEVMKRAPWLFAAGVLFSAADDNGINQMKLQSVISGIPLWIFQGGLDKKPTVAQTEGYVRQFREAGGTVRYTLYPELGHGTWNKAFAEPDFFTWMLGKRKNNIHVKGGDAIICATTGEGARLSLPLGFADYQWEYNGVIIADKHINSIEAKLAGSYRARSKVSGWGNEWNEWSEIINVVEKNPEAPVLTQSGTIVLKDPNGNNQAFLQCTQEYAHYYWYKDEKSISPESLNEIGSNIKLSSGGGNGAYTLKVSSYDGCISPASIAKHVFFSNSAPQNIESPANLTLTCLSPSEVQIAWQDISGNEDGFEIWRKETSKSTWTMVAITNVNVQAFKDTNLYPASRYDYMVRAVSTSGRSAYTTVGQVETFNDTAAPSAPQELEVEMTGVHELTLTWTPSSDNSAVKEYLIFYEGDTLKTNSSTPSFIVTDFELNKRYDFNVRAVDLSDNISEASNDAGIFTKMYGLFYQHSTGDWGSLNEIDWSVAEFKGKVKDFTLSPKTQEDFFNFRFDGYINIVNDGVYQFRISSNDGSNLFLDDTLLISNDGVHNLVTVTGPIQILDAGPHRITVNFFDNTLADSLLVEYKGPDSNNEWVGVGAAVLGSDVITAEEDLLSEEFEFSFYPNPYQHDILNLVLPETLNEPMQLSIVSSIGKLVFRKTIAPSQHVHLITSDELQALTNGVYILHLTGGNYKASKRLIISD